MDSDNLEDLSKLKLCNKIQPSSVVDKPRPTRLAVGYTALSSGIWIQESGPGLFP